MARGRPRDERTTTGRQKQIPRSLGAVFEAIRNRLGFSQEQMIAALEAQPSEYALPKAKKKQSEKNANVSSRISRWETAKDNVPFSVQHRYGGIAGTYSGVLHLVSLFYANLRDVATAPEDPSKLQENLKIAQGLIQLSEAIIANSLPNAQHERLSRLANYNDPIHLDLINEFLDAYRRGCETAK